MNFLPPVEKFVDCAILFFLSSIQENPGGGNTIVEKCVEVVEACIRPLFTAREFLGGEQKDGFGASMGKKRPP